MDSSLSAGQCMNTFDLNNIHNHLINGIVGWVKKKNTFQLPLFFEFEHFYYILVPHGLKKYVSK